MIVQFSDDADTATKGAVLAGLAGWTLKVEYNESVTGFPEECAIERVSQDDIVMCDVDEEGQPMPHSLYHVGYDEIKSITII
jgi:hypothetical protein